VRRPLAILPAVTRGPLDYLFLPFNSVNFPDLFWPITIAAGVLLIAQVILYNVQTRRMRRHEPLVTLQEWLFWTGLITFSMLLIMALFVWYFAFVLLTIALGVVTYLWIRFIRFPPLIAAYNEQLRRARFFSQSRYKHPEATIRSRRSRRRR
jgi:small-conductance mechanosensitive channel